MSLLEKRIIEEARQNSEVSLDQQLGRLRGYIAQTSGNKELEAVDSLLNELKQTVLPAIQENAVAFAIEEFYLKVRNLGF